MKGIIILLVLCHSTNADNPTQITCPINEEFRPDGGPACENCGPRCLMLSLEAKCYCKTGFSRLYGVCVLDIACPPQSGTQSPHLCPVNEQYNPNGGPMCENCGLRCLALTNEAKCYCKPGHSRLNGICIPDGTCPKDPDNPTQITCPINEEFRPDGGPACENCGPRCLMLSLEAKCYCKTGFSRLYGVCVLDIACPPQTGTPTEHPCPVNEQYNPNGGPMCENCGIRCLALTSEAKCYCKPGHSRLNGICILDVACPKDPGTLSPHPCPVNEEFNPNGGPLCENCGIRCLAITNEAKCYCKPDHSRLNGICIPDTSCPKEPVTPVGHPCPVNEEYSATGGALCENCGPQCLALSSEPKCYCKPDHSRLNGICIPNETCPPEPVTPTPTPNPCPANEEFSADGGPKCENCGPRRLVWSYEAKCYCKSGYSRSGGICIPDSTCPKRPVTSKPHSCPVNEGFGPDGGPKCENCGAKCLEWSYEAKCYCKSGYSRLNEICIPNSRCPKRPITSTPPTPTTNPCPVNEEFSADGGPKCENCGPRCLVWSDEAKCYCRSGYSRSGGICIPDSKCPERPVTSKPHSCPVNEGFGPDGGPKCENCGTRCLVWSYEAKCYCKSGYSRLNEICIPDSSCPKHPITSTPPTPTTTTKLCPVNEEFSADGGPKCENCGPRCLVWSDEAKCYCKSGYSRSGGICIPDSTCPKRPVTSKPHSCPVNEGFGPDGGPKCENCGTRCLVWSYEAKCYCKSGYSRSNGICIPDSRCPKHPRKPKPRQCPRGEAFSPIGPRCEFCKHRCSGYKRESKCYCLADYLRDRHGKCVPSGSCTRRL